MVKIYLTRKIKMRNHTFLQEVMTKKKRKEKKEQSFASLKMYSFIS
jgi:hypothetical protein